LVFAVNSSAVFRAYVIPLFINAIWVNNFKKVVKEFI